MPSPAWYLRRLRTMSPRELAWRAASGLREGGMLCRLALGVEPTSAAPSVGGSWEPGFRVSDVRVGEWASPGTDEERVWRDRLLVQADRIARHRLTFFDLVERDLGDPIDWNRDHASGKKAPLRFAPLIDYRDHRVAGDAKVVWEPNRHHHLVVLARAYRATGERRYASAVVEQLSSWLDQCPFGRGMAWRSPLELAIRLINWVWAVDLIHESGLLAPGLRARLWRAAHLHLWEITRKYSRGSSANNHRIGEAAGVFIGTSYFDEPRGGSRWRSDSQRILCEEITAQTHADGGSREQAMGYQLFVLELLLLAGLVGRQTGADFPAVYWSRLARMLEFVGALHEGGAALPMFGDCDDGYVLDLGDARDPRVLFCLGTILLGRADLKTWAGRYAEPARWLLGRASRAAFDAIRCEPAETRLAFRAFPESGWYLLQSGHRGANDRISILFDCGELGLGPIAAHGHADALSFTLRASGTDVFVDPGTYDYFSFPAWREYFRSTRAHNTVVIDGGDQSVMLGPFLWGTRARVRCLVWEPRSGGGRVVGEHDGYTRLADPVVHRRTLELDAASRVLTIRDDIVAHGEHEIAVYFHLAEHAVVASDGPQRYMIALEGGRVVLEVDPRLAVEILKGSEAPIAGWVSRGYHRKVPSTTLVARGQCRGSASFVCHVEIQRPR